MLGKIKFCLVGLALAILSACGGSDNVASGSGSGSGIGGTGISFVKGNIVSVDGASFSGGTTISVTSGEANTNVNANGNFELSISNNRNVVLVFTVDGVNQSSLELGEVAEGQILVARDIKIDTVSGKAVATTIFVQKEVSDIADTAEQSTSPSGNASGQSEESNTGETVSNQDEGGGENSIPTENDESSGESIGGSVNSNVSSEGNGKDNNNRGGNNNRSNDDDDDDDDDEDGDEDDDDDDDDDD